MSDFSEQARRPRRPRPPQSADPRFQRPLPRINAGRLWEGGIGAALVVAVVIVVGMLLVRGVFGIPVLAPEGAGVYGSADTTGYALLGAGFALLATALLYLLLLFMPNPLTFFYWIMALLTAAVVILPFTFDTDNDTRIATAAINLIAGLCLMCVLGSVGASSIRYQPHA
ncbi:DUF6069 family protein [Nocardia sp. NPDC050710]|uniref:DUF6069 family protein n=1 Tax=Nocardia sp. NPDC050710 TaxID=3157220 RepID=UPI0033E4EB12